MIGGLTKRQYEALCFIEQYCKETGMSPTYDEIRIALQLKSKSGVHRIISALSERELIHKRSDRARSISVIEKYCRVCGSLLP